MKWMCFLIASDDLIWKKIPRFPRDELRDCSMRLFFEDVDREELMLQNMKTEMKHFCNEWISLQCINEEITMVRFNEFKLGNLNISALPHTTDFVWITNSDQTFTIETKSFPRNLKYISLNRNRITGTPDLTNLPVNLAEALFGWNKMTGPISLTRLPQNLLRLELHDNEIRQKTVWYDNLPEGIKMIGFGTSSKSIGNKIRCVRPVHPDRALVDKSVFRGVAEAKIS